MKIVDLSSSFPGGICANIMSALGADVIKVERPGGDPSRHRELGPNARASDARFRAFYAGCRSISLDLSRVGGQEAAQRIVSQADAVVTAYRPGTAERLRMDYRTLSGTSKRLVYCAFVNYRTEDYPDRSGHDLNYLAESGLLDLMRCDDGSILIPPVPLSDITAGMAASVALLAATGLAEGRGRHIQIPVSNCAVWLMAGLLPELHHLGPPQERRSSLRTGRVDPLYNTYVCSDGLEIAVGAVENRLRRNFFRSLDRACGGRQTVTDPNDLADIVRSRPRDYWLDAFGKEDCAVSPVVTVDDLVRTTGEGDATGVDTLRVDQEGAIRLEPPISGGWEASDASAPTLGEHTLEILIESGLSPDEARSLLEAEIAA